MPAAESATSLRKARAQRRLELEPSSETVFLQWLDACKAADADCPEQEISNITYNFPAHRDALFALLARTEKTSRFAARFAPTAADELRIFRTGHIPAEPGRTSSFLLLGAASFSSSAGYGSTPPRPWKNWESLSFLQTRWWWRFTPARRRIRVSAVGHPQKSSSPSQPGTRRHRGVLLSAKLIPRFPACQERT